MRLIFAGTPRFAAVALQALLDQGHDLVLVLTQPDRAAGRGMSVQQSQVKQLAQRHALPVYQPHTLRHEEALSRLRAARADAMVVAAYGLILPQAVLDLFPLGCLNIHASLLPRWRGAAPIQRAIEAGDKETGISIMHMEAGLDTGPVYLTAVTQIAAADTSATLHDRLAVLGGRTICEALRMIGEGGLQPTPQASEGVTYAGKITKGEAVLDWSRSAQELERQIRAFNPFPVATTAIRGEPVRVWESTVVLDTAEGLPGVVTRIDAGGIVVRCGGGGALRLESMQRAGGRRLLAAEFLRGMPIGRGERLGPTA